MRWSYFVTAVVLLLLGVLTYLIIINNCNRIERKTNKHALTKLKKEVKNYKLPEKFSPHNYVNEFYAILMPSRLNYVKKSMKSFGINPKVVNAIRKDTLNRDELFEKNIIAVNLHPGKIACHLSHVKALKRFLQETKDDPNATAIIFEDDIQHCFNKKVFFKRFAMIMDSLNKRRGEFDIVYLGKCYDPCRKNTTVDIQIRASTSPLCRHAYLVTHKAANTIINRTFPMTDPGDVMIRRLIDEGELRCLSLFPSLFYQNRKVLGTHLQNTNLDLKECEKNSVHYGDFSNSPFYKVSVVVLNWRRPENVEKILSHYVHYEAVNEIIVYNNNTKVPFHSVYGANKKVKIVQSKTNDLTNRYRGAGMARNKAVLIQDDDILLPEESIVELANYLLGEPYRIHGIFGRRINYETPRSLTKSNPSTNPHSVFATYDTERDFGPEVDILLTRALMTRRSLARRFFDYAKRLKNVDLSKNGEDIAFSLISTHVYRNKPRAYDLKFIDFDNKNDKEAIHVKDTQHVQKRTNVIRECLNVFND